MLVGIVLVSSTILYWTDVACVVLAHILLHSQDDTYANEEQLGNSSNDDHYLATSSGGHDTVYLVPTSRGGEKAQRASTDSAGYLSPFDDDGGAYVQPNDGSGFQLASGPITGGRNNVSVHSTASSKYGFMAHNQDDDDMYAPVDTSNTRSLHHGQQQHAVAYEYDGT